MCITNSALGLRDLTNRPSLTLMSAADPSAAQHVPCIPSYMCTVCLQWSFASISQTLGDKKTLGGPSRSAEGCSLHVLSVFLNWGQWNYLIFPKDVTQHSSNTSSFPFHLSFWLLRYFIKRTGEVCWIPLPPGMYLTGTCCSYLGRVRWANAYADITVTSSSIDLYWSRHIVDVLCWFKELFSVDTCQVPSLPHFHLLMRETVLCENTEVLSFSSTKQK